MTGATSPTLQNHKLSRQPACSGDNQGLKEEQRGCAGWTFPTKHRRPPRSTGTTMSPAPCALAISHDQVVRFQKLTHIPTQVGCRARQSFQIAMTNSVVAPPSWSHWDGITAPTM